MTTIPKAFLPGMATWKLSAAWASKELDCTLEGILDRCGGACCHSQQYWPPRTGDGGTCPRLGPMGCELGAARPITCLLYPLRLNNSGTLVLHVRATTGCCRRTYRVGGRSIARNLRDSLALLFGAEAADQAVADVEAGKDATLEVPEWVLEALAEETEWEDTNTVPKARTGGGK